MKESRLVSMQLAAHHWDLRRGEPISVAVEAWAWTTSRGLGLDSSKYVLQWLSDKPAIAQLVEHLTVETCSNQMVPGSIPGGRICSLFHHGLEQYGEGKEEGGGRRNVWSFVWGGSSSVARPLPPISFF